MTALPLWHSILFVPAHVERFVKAAQTRGADAIQLDLEDSVPLDSKTTAREKLQLAIEHLTAHQQDIIVRVNRDLGTCIKDLEAAVRPGVNAICLPKVMGADHVRLIDETITELEIKNGLPIGGIRLIAMIETIEALLAVEKLAQACPRLAGLTLGSEDLSFDGGFDPSTENLLPPCQSIVYAARAANIRCYGFPGSIADFSDMEAFQPLIAQAKSMGFNGAFCIHPKQVDVVNDIYHVTDEKIQQAQKIVNAYEMALVRKIGAVEVDGKMVDLPVVERARELLK